MCTKPSPNYMIEQGGENGREREYWEGRKALGGCGNMGVYSVHMFLCVCRS